MRNQVKFVFQLGYAERHAHFEANVIAAASAICGGCTTSNKVGWWCADGAERKERFAGRVEKEHCFQLELTCEEHKAERAYQLVTEEIAAAAADFQVEIDWVHVSETEIKGRHFSVKAAQAKMGLIAA